MEIVMVTYQKESISGGFRRYTRLGPYIAFLGDDVTLILT